MTKKIRLIILLASVACFLLVAPVLVFYSMGYRFDFEKFNLTETGGIYVRTFPAADEINIDSKIIKKPGLFANSIFVQSLLPNEHTVLVTKEGFYDYFKTIPVEKKQVTKLEDILLIKKNLAFSIISGQIDYFSVAPNNQNILTAKTGSKNITLEYSSLSSGSGKSQTLSIASTGKVIGINWSDDSNKALIKIQTYSGIAYQIFDNNFSIQTTAKEPSLAKASYLDKNAKQISFNPQDYKQLFFIKNKILYLAKDNVASPIISKAVAYKISGNSIIWLSSEGLLYSSDYSGKLIEQLTAKKIAITAQNIELFTRAGRTFLQADSSLFVLNQETKALETIKPPLSNYKILASLNDKIIIYWNSSKIYLYSFETEKYEELFSGSQISDCQWVNESHIIFADGNKIIISEIDYRGNINAVTLPQTIEVSKEQKINIQNPVIFFNRQDNKVYILTDNTLLSSEKIIP